MLVTTKISLKDMMEAQRLLSQRPIYRGSHRGAAANEIGCLGEAIALRVFAESGIPLTEVFATTHDFLLPNGQSVEVKTKDRTVPPEPHFDCSIPEYVAGHQTANFYAFISLERSKTQMDGMERFHTAHLVGIASPRLMAQRGRLMQAGTTDVNGTTFWTSCRNIAIRDLVPFFAANLLWRKLT